MGSIVNVYREALPVLRGALSEFKGGKASTAFVDNPVFRNEGLNVLHKIYYLMWIINGQPRIYNNGKHTFLDNHSSLLKKAKAVELCIRQLEADVVIVGGGPVGLWTAILAKIRNAKLNIFVMEKRVEYKRQQELHVEESSFKNIPYHPDLQYFVDELKGRKIVPIQEIESKLSQLAAKLDICVLTGLEVATPLSLHDDFPNAKFFIGADGSRSRIRKEIFNDNYAFNVEGELIANVKYRTKQAVECDRGSIYALTTRYQTHKAISFPLVREYRSRKDPQVTTLCFAIDKLTYEGMKGADMQHPFNFKSDQMSTRLLSDIYLWFGTRQHYFNEERDLNYQEKITVFPLRTYASESFIKNWKIEECHRGSHRDTVWSLVGDAGCGLPFFRGFNFGLTCGNKLSLAIASSTYTQFQKYDAFLKQESLSKKKDSDHQNRLIGIYRNLLQLANSFPIQLFQWSLQEKELFKMLGKYPEWSPLVIAAEHGYGDLVDKLLCEGADVNGACTNAYHRSALMQAARNGHEQIVTLLLSKGALINAQDGEGWSALMLASWQGHAPIVKALIARGANTSLVNNKGQTALAIAHQYKQTGIAQLFAGLPKITFSYKINPDSCEKEPASRLSFRPYFMPSIKKEPWADYIKV